MYYVGIYCYCKKETIIFLYWFNFLSREGEQSSDSRKLSAGLADKFGPEVGSGRRERRGSASPVKRSHFVMIISPAGLIGRLVKET